MNINTQGVQMVDLLSKILEYLPGIAKLWENQEPSLDVIQSLSYFYFAKLTLIQFAHSNLVGSIILTFLSIFKGVSQHCNIT